MVNLDGGGLVNSEVIVRVRVIVMLSLGRLAFNHNSV